MCLLLCLVGLSCKKENEPLSYIKKNLDIKIKLDSTVYYQGKPIIGEYTITNISDEDFRYDVICKYMIVDSAKCPYYSELFNVVQNMPIEKLKEPYFFLSINKKDSVNSKYDFHNLRWNYWDVFYANIDSFPKGDYTVRLYLNVVHDWYIQDYVSNDIIIKIK